MRLRSLPTVGAPVTVVHLAARVPGTVEDVQDGGRRLLVVTEEGELLSFALSRTTGEFRAGARQDGARLRFEDPSLSDPAPRSPGSSRR